ncbi:hypothetical protein WR25_18042 [Diploscapter pachys]|uniref:Uncharacterized protein n=1 Tax=Diploscapter pachys TaxID=2018661 RepID=A0A2A2JEB2_9BILA|nr:hypothetical protein WR25_18042 [Diploscapter pachys]
MSKEKNKSYVPLNQSSNYPVDSLYAGLQVMLQTSSTHEKASLNGSSEAILQRERQLQKTRSHCRGDDEMVSIGRDRDKQIDIGKAANLHGETPRRTLDSSTAACGEAVSKRKKQLLFELEPTELTELNGKNGQGNGKNEAEMKNKKEEEEAGKARGDEAASRMEANTPKAAFFPKECRLQVVSKTAALHGGRLVSILDENGHMHVGVEYDREQMLRYSQSPFAVLPPTSIRSIVLDLPEILSSFPVRFLPPSAKSANSPFHPATRSNCPVPFFQLRRQTFCP